jgi:hypothetical protein
MSGYDWQLVPYKIGIIPFPGPHSTPGRRNLLAAELLPPFPPGFYLTNLQPLAVTAPIAYAVLPRLYQAILFVQKPVMGPFPYGLPVRTVHTFP